MFSEDKAMALASAPSSKQAKGIQAALKLSGFDSCGLGSGDIPGLKAGEIVVFPKADELDLCVTETSKEGGGKGSFLYVLIQRNFARGTKLYWDWVPVWVFRKRAEETQRSEEDTHPLYQLLVSSNTPDLQRLNLLAGKKFTVRELLREKEYIRKDGSRVKRPYKVWLLDEVKGGRRG